LKPDFVDAWDLLKNDKIWYYRVFKFVRLPNSVGIVPVKPAEKRSLFDLIVKDKQFIFEFFFIKMIKYDITDATNLLDSQVLLGLSQLSCCTGDIYSI